MKHSIFKTIALGLMTAIVAGPIAAQRQQPAQQITQIKVMPRDLTEAQLKTHEIAPAHIKNVQIEEVDASREVNATIKINPKNFPKIPTVDLAGFSATVHNVLKDSVAGYIMQTRQNGVLVNNMIWNWAQTPADASKGWTENTRMHVASVSKFLTAVAMVKLLDAKGISYDAKISQYLPTYWTKGNNIGQISFRNLFQHASGFSVPGSSCDYQTMKTYIAAGVSNVGQGSGYENLNYSLMRVMIAIINGDMDKNATYAPTPALNDVIWDGLSIAFYRQYMQDNVFTPSGVANASFAPPASGNALAYPFPSVGVNGWNSGNLQSVSGAAAWHLSTKELGAVLDTVRRKGTILPKIKAQYMLDNYFGIDQMFDTPAGKIYNKNGGWGSGGNSEQCVAYFFPNGMEVVLFVNSPIGAQGLSVRNTVRDAFLANLK
jgi:CubicO group peptidase (beta-lactamase class C family)